MSSHQIKNCQKMTTYSSKNNNIFFNLMENNKYFYFYRVCILFTFCCFTLSKYETG